MFGDARFTNQRLRHALNVLRSRGFLRIEEHDDGEPVDCILTIA